MKKYILKTFMSALVLVGCDGAQKNDEVHQSSDLKVGAAESIKPSAKGRLKMFHTAQEVIADKFVNDYVAYLKDKKTEVTILDWVKTKGVTDSFVKALSTRLDTNEDYKIGLKFDPVILAQEVPKNGFKVIHKDDEDYITLQSLHHENHKIQLKVVYSGGKWNVDGCGAVNIPKERQEMTPFFEW